MVASDRPCRQERMTDAELETFEEVVGELGDQVNEFLAEGTDRTPDEVAAAIDDLPKPDPLADEQQTHQRTRQLAVWMG